MHFYTVLGVLATISASSAIRYDNYTLYRFVPKNVNEVIALTNLEKSNLKGYDFWTHAEGVGSPVDILVSPEEKNNFKQMVNNYKMDFEILMENIQEQIDEEAKINKEVNLNMGLSWDSYYGINQIYQWLSALSFQYPTIVSLIEGGRSYHGRPILGVKLTFRPGNEKRGVWLDSLIHAREWISGATNTFILNELLTSTDSVVRKVAESHDWYIFPVINPDGYEYTHTTNRLWRKTRTPYSLFCYGADPNRNWGYMWNTGGASNNPCDDTYAGPRPFSEIETASLAEYMSTVAHNLIAYISFHSYSQMFLLPYGYTYEHLDNYDEVVEITTKGAHALAARYGTEYTVGNSAEMLYIATGGSDDWVKGNFHVPIVLTPELRDTGSYGFLLPANQIIPTGLETLDALVTILQEADKKLLNMTVV